MARSDVAADQLRLYIERIERLEEEKKGVGDDIKDVYLEAKSLGYDVKIMREIVRLRKMPEHDRNEMRAILETYLAALGMENGPGHTPDMFVGHDGRPDPSTPAPAPSADQGEKFMAALNLVVDNQKASTSWLQRQLRIGYNAAARLVEQLEAHGVVGPPDNVGRREVLVPPGGEAHPAHAMMANSAVEQMENTIAALADKGITMTVRPGLKGLGAEVAAAVAETLQ